MSNYRAQLNQATATIGKMGPTWHNIDAEHLTRMRLQNRFATGLDIARYTADIMVENMLDAEAEEGIGAFLDKREPNWPR